MKNKDDYNDLKKKTFKVREKNTKVQRHLKKALFTYLHLENMINLLLESEYIKNKEKYNEKITKDKNNDWEIFNLLTNKEIMKGVLSNNTGGDATKENIKKVNEYFKDNKIFNAAKKINKDLNSHNMSMIVARIRTNWSNYFLNKKSWFAIGSASGLTGLPKYPKPKKLSRANYYSLPVETQNFSLKHRNMLELIMHIEQ